MNIAWLLYSERKRNRLAIVQFTKNDHTEQGGVVGRGRPNAVGGFLWFSQPVPANSVTVPQ